MAYFVHTFPANGRNLPKIQVLAQQLTFLDTAQRLDLTPSQTSSLSAPPSLTVGKMLVTIFAFALFSARLYRYGVLM